jgi:hypothetical protein
MLKEHGAWAVFFVPLVIGAGLGGGFDWFALFFTLSSLGIFLSYLPAQTVLREAFGRAQDQDKLIAAYQWTAIYFTAGILLGLPVLVIRERWLLLPIGVASMGCFLLSFFLARRQPKTITSDLVSVLGVTLTGPSMYYVVTGQLDRTAFVLWLLNILFFASCIFHVQMRIRALGVKKTQWSFGDRLRCNGFNLIFHAVMIAVLLLLVFEHWIPSIVLFAFAPITVYAVCGTAKLTNDRDFRKLGLTLLGHSIVFMVLLLVLLR